MPNLLEEGFKENEEEWLKGYFDLFIESLLQKDVRIKLIQLKELMQKTHSRDGKAVFIGNGGSGAIASHCAVDFTKNARIRSISFSDENLITCLSNDYGYEFWVEKALDFYANANDLVILISSSGKSPNMVRGGQYAKEHGITLATMTGFAENNPLKSLGDLNLWVNSRAYNIVEMTHHIWLMGVCDLIIGTPEYPSS